jgi:hypothetical protein
MDLHRKLSDITITSLAIHFEPFKRSTWGGRRVGGRPSQTRASPLTHLIISHFSICWPVTNSFHMKGQCRSLWRMIFFFSKDLPLEVHISLGINLGYIGLGTITDQDGQSTSTGFIWTSRPSWEAKDLSLKEAGSALSLTSMGRKRDMIGSLFRTTAHQSIHPHRPMQFKRMPPCLFQK